jgi:hypothetical protein
VTGAQKDNGLFVLYYGEPTGPDGERLRRAAPALLVVGQGLESRADVPAFFRGCGTRVVVYIATGYGKKQVAEQVDAALGAGYDGVFFDEAESGGGRTNAELAQMVRRRGEDRLVIMNPGHACVDVSIFAHADIVSVENQWDCQLPGGIAPRRWMAVQGDPSRAAPESLDEAQARLLTFRKNGGYWYWSAHKTTERSSHGLLPPWLERFADWVKTLPCRG